MLVLKNIILQEQHQYNNDTYLSCLDNDKDAIISNKYYRFQLDDAYYGQEIFHDVTLGM